MFGKFVKEKRLALDLTLREFCRRIEEDPSNWSKVEREVMAPPQNMAKLAKIAEVLGLKAGSPGRKHLDDLAAIDAGHIPEFIMSDKEVLQALPAFFRTVGNVKPSREDLKDLIERLKK